MALKGLDIFKLSPKKNCKECGSPTCMAFCMKVAQGAVSIDKCPYFSDDAKAMLQRADRASHEDHHRRRRISWAARPSCSVTRRLWSTRTCTPFPSAPACPLRKPTRSWPTCRRLTTSVSASGMYVEFVFVANKQSRSREVYAELVKKAAATGRDLILECWDVECAKAALAVAGHRSRHSRRRYP